MPSTIRGGDNFDSGQKLTLMAAQNSTSGTAIDFTGIPSWAKRVTVMFYGVSTSGTSLLRIRLGTSSGVEATGYIGDYNPVSTNPYYVQDVTDGIPLNAPSTVAAANTYSGVVVFSNISGNKWVADGGSKSSSYLVGKVGGFKELAGVLDRIRITTVIGTDTFDAGSINVMYE